ncbi:MAG: hypothetical protein HC924_16960, partial [Synechococcaceae cyanobacterium SM2_3_2]|nr:hypothetical protein [Synechococcaceae cyanobacterium SM2_3_2]
MTGIPLAGSHFGLPVTSLSGHRGRITGLGIDSTGSRLHSASLDGLIKIWDLHTHQCLHTLQGHQEGINTLAYVPGLLVSGGREGWVMLWDPETGCHRKTIDLNVGSIHRVALCSDRQRLVMAGGHPTLLMVDLERGEPFRASKADEGEVRTPVATESGVFV